MSGTNHEITEPQLRDELISSLNHDMRSPLGAIGIFCEILLLNPDSLDDSQRQSLSMIQEANAKALRILDDAAELASIYKGSATLRISASPLREIVELSLAKSTDADQGNYPALAIEGPSELEVLVDTERTGQLVLRLLEEVGVQRIRNGELQLTINSADGFAELAMAVTGSESSPGAPSKTTSPASVKGRLGVRKPAESHYSLVACQKLAALMGGSLTYNLSPFFTASLRLPLSSR